EDGIRDTLPSRGLGDVYKRQIKHSVQLSRRQNKIRLAAIKFKILITSVFMCLAIIRKWLLSIMWKI
ncbi:MAG: hypothetical protein RIR60_743, partial [Pseudomonadota bacterium]